MIKKSIFKTILTSSVILSTTLFGAVSVDKTWEHEETLLTFFEKNQIPLKVYYDLPREEKNMVEEIRSGATYYMLKDEDTNKLEQVLIPISEELQIHIVNKDNKYSLNIKPISYQETEKMVGMLVQKSPYQDIVEKTGNTSLANNFIDAYSKSINFRKFVRKDDKLAIVYKQKIRLGKSFSEPKILSALIETNKRENYVFLNKDGRYYNDKGKLLEGFLLHRPIKNFKRISSGFTLRRWHPVLKRYRAHHGVDYAARKGTPVYSSGDGRITSVRYRGGYGKTVEIQHQGGYKTLYAHLNSYASASRVGRYVKKGQFIGRVGNTGMSTGPHLHFGLYKHNRPINPGKVIRIAKKVLKGKNKDNFMQNVKVYKNKIASIKYNDINLDYKQEKTYITFIDNKFHKVSKDI
jgi:murein DD-endopeptidase MepM/ murein hydrolase activator NlpD